MGGERGGETRRGGVLTFHIVLKKGYYCILIYAIIYIQCKPCSEGEMERIESSSDWSDLFKMISCDISEGKGWRGCGNVWREKGRKRGGKENVD